MNPLTLKEAEKLFSGVAKGMSSIKKTEVVICPPFLYLERLKKIRTSKIKLGAQDSFWGEVGAYTGEVSGEMLYNVGVRYVILGHSERRTIGENNQDINKKIKGALTSSLVPILCVGESVRDEEHSYFNLVKTQLEECLIGISKNSISKVIIAYEPVWAIGASSAMSPRDIHEMAIYIKKVLREMYGTLGDGVRILYGGAVGLENAGEIVRDGFVCGLLVVMLAK